jgi:hypothetical protein
MATDNSMQMGAKSQKTFVLSSDPNKAMQQMMETIDSLRAVYIEENSALQSADTKKFLGLQDKKIAAARNYQYGAEQMVGRKDELQHIDNALKQALMQKQEEFAGIMAENLKGLDRIRKGVQRLNDRIMTSAREAAQTKNVNYSNKGKLNKNERPVSIGVSESA